MKSPEVEHNLKVNNKKNSAYLLIELYFKCLFIQFRYKDPIFIHCLRHWTISNIIHILQLHC